MRLLEAEGLLVSRGGGRRRRIELPRRYDPPVLRVQILLYGPEDTRSHWVLDVQHRLLEAGHVAGFASRTLLDLKMDVEQVVRFIRRTPADAWVILGGSQAVLDWCAKRPKPFFALAGRLQGLPIAGTGPDKVPALLTALRRLIALGHRRIVLLQRGERRKPSPGRFERVFLQELQAHGIPTGAYNLPDWNDTTEDFHRCLDALFRQTPPTALIVGEMPPFLAAQLHLARRGVLAPRDVSLICDDPDPTFAWCRPSVAHIAWDSKPWALRIVRWANNVARGKDDRRQSFTRAAFVEGGSIGPAPAARGTTA